MRHFPCRAPWDGAVVHFSGAVYPCNNISQGPEMSEMRLGDLNQQSLDDILNGDKARKLRQRLLDGDITGLLCETCDKAKTCNPYGDPSHGEEGTEIHGGAQLQQVRPSLNPTPLVRLELGLTDLCNMKCIMCCLSWGEASPAQEPQKGMMDFKLLNSLIDQIQVEKSRQVTAWLHWIGEPLIYPQIDELCQKLDNKGVILHLVTNAIQLTPQRQKHLLSLTGRHTLNVSLNARYSDTFQRVNQSNTFTRVDQHTRQFLKSGIAQKQWNILLSAVILEENWREIPEMVAYWFDHIRKAGGVPSLTINGKPNPPETQSPYQVVLLREVAMPRAIVYFRTVLRACKPDIEGWDLELWSEFDGLFIEEKWAEIPKVIDRLSPENGRLATEILWDSMAISSELGLYLVNRSQTNELEGVLKSVLERGWIFDEDPCPFSLVNLPPHLKLLLARIFPNSRQQCLNAIPKGAWADSSLCHLMGRWVYEEATLSPLGFPNGPFSNTEAGLLVRFWLGNSPLEIPKLEHDWVLRAFAGLISLREQPQWPHTVHRQTNETVYARLLESIDPKNLPESLKGIDIFDCSQSWVLRACRRRYFASGQIISFPAIVVQRIETKLDWELLLWAIMGGRTIQISELSKGLLSDTGFGDLSEVLNCLDLEPSICLKLSGWAIQSLDCPLLSLTINQKLGLIRCVKVVGQKEQLASLQSMAKSMYSEITGWRRAALDNIFPSLHQ